MTGPLVLASGVTIAPVSALPARTRKRVPHARGDYTVSREGARTPSRVVDAASRALLLEFEEPTRIVDAVIRFANRSGDDPRRTLEDAFEMLRGMVRTSILVAPERREDDGGSGARPGDRLLDWTLVACVHELEDTQVFFAHDAAERAVAVKIVREARSAEREARAMRRAAARAPGVFGVHEWRGRGVLVSEWIWGDDATTAAADLRGRRGPRSEEGLLALCIEVVRSYAEIHQGGLLHGDVHPGNVRIETTGRARLLDMGLAVEKGDAETVPRGGVAFYMEPEQAAAAVRGESAPLTEKSEQFAVGALLYQLWTGEHHADFTLERSKMLSQLVAPAPVPFARRRIPAWPELEIVLRRALAREPDARFPSCAAFADALESLRLDARPRDATAGVKRARRAEGDPTRELVSKFLARCGPGGSALRDGPANAPYGSVNYGAAGITYAICKLAAARDDARLLAMADVWAQKTGLLAEHGRAFHDPALAIDAKHVGEVSLFHSVTGVHAVHALVALARGEGAVAQASLDAFVAATRAGSPLLDVALGTAGLLTGCAELVEASRGAADCDPGGVRLRGDELRDALLASLVDECVATSPLLDTLGFAHGWAGVLFALLRWCQATGTSAEPYRARFEELAALAEPHGTSVRWPIHNRSVVRTSYMDGWCNGAAGHALLWALAYEMLGDPRHAVLAERAAASAWRSEIKLGTICCGLAGIGYACAAVHRVTGDAVWLARAKDAARLACRDRSKHFLRDSLYKGAVGAMLLHEELDAGHAATPFLER